MIYINYVQIFPSFPSISVFTKSEKIRDSSARFGTFVFHGESTRKEPAKPWMGTMDNIPSGKQLVAMKHYETLDNSGMIICQQVQQLQDFFHLVESTKASKETHGIGLNNPGRPRAFHFSLAP